MIPTPPSPLHLTLLYTSRLHGRIQALPRLFTLIQQERAAAQQIASTVILLDLGESCVVDDWLCQATGGRALLVAMDSFGTDGFFLDQADPLSFDPEILAKLRAVIVTPVFSEQQPLSVAKRVINATSDGQQAFYIASWDAPDVPSSESPEVTDGVNRTNWPFALTIRVSRHIPNSDAVRYDSNRQTLWLADPPAESDAVGLTRVTLTRFEDGKTRLNRQRLVVTPDLRPDPTVSGVVEFVLAEAGYAARSQRNGRNG